MAAQQQSILGLDQVEGSDPLEQEQIECSNGDPISRIDTCCGSFFLCRKCSLGLAMLMMTAMLPPGAAPTLECPTCHQAALKCWRPIVIEGAS